MPTSLLALIRKSGIIKELCLKSSYYLTYLVLSLELINNVRLYNVQILLFLTFTASSLFTFGCSGSVVQSVNNTPDAHNVIDDIRFSNLSELNYVATVNSYQINPHDLLEIKFFQAEELSQEVRVNLDGYMSLPLVGKLKATGLTPEELQAVIASTLKKTYLQNPQVTVFIKEYTNQRVVVGGDVNKPGVFPIVGQMTLLQAIAQAGGLADLAKITEVVIFRKVSGGMMKAYLLNLKEIRKGGGKDPYLQNEDKVIVQRSGSRQWLKDIRINLPFMGAVK